jgi:hypothetical protein
MTTTKKKPRGGKPASPHKQVATLDRDVYEAMEAVKIEEKRSIVFLINDACRKVYLENK